MKRLTAFLLLAASLGIPASLCAQSKNTYSQPTNVSKAEKKQAKAQKKYAKQQKKAEKKMLKTSKKNTHYPPQQF
jgi:membrane protein insertase Oxa1/YidC/SpoIIIJ